MDTSIKYQPYKEFPKSRLKRGKNWRADTSQSMVSDHKRENTKEAVQISVKQNGEKIPK